MKISITLPSIFPDALARALRNVRDATRCAHEIIVVSPTKPPDICGKRGTLKWIHEKTSTGCNAAHMAAFEEASGEFITGWVDDHYYCDGWDVIAIKDFEEREAIFHAQAPGMPFELGLRHVWPTHVGTEFGMYYPYFPFMRRTDAVTVGWLTDEYRTGFADSDLAMRVWDAGGRCEWSSCGLVVVHSDDSRKNGVIFKPEDMALFLKRWAPRYGNGWNISDLRGFNNDLTPEKFPQFVDASKRSIRYNHPDFKTVVGIGG